MKENARILIVDDDETIRKTLRAILEEKGYKVDAVDTGRKAIKKTKTKFYNLALIDIRLPDMEGVKLLLRMKETTPKMRKIIITGYPSLKNAIEAVNKGADSYVIKPLNINEILTLIEKHLKKQREEQKFTEEKVAEFIETRVKQLEQEKF